MMTFLRGLLGTYTPVTYELIEEHYDSAGVIISQTIADVVPAGVAGLDWGYITGAVLWVVVIYCLLRTIGGLLCQRW